MKIQTIQTRKMIPPKDDLWELLQKYLVPKLKENCIVAVTSKIISIGEGRCIPINQVVDKDRLIIQEAEKYLSRNLTPGKHLMHTIKFNALMPSAGIDVSNANGYYILSLRNPHKSSRKIWHFLKDSSGVKNLGIIITDSHSIPMRWGIMGISLSYFGFKPLVDYRHKNDLFGRKLQVSQANIPDSLAAAACLAMGEGSEQTPLAIISNLPKGVKFVSRNPKQSQARLNFYVPAEYDLYKPIIESVPWKKGGSF